MVVHLGRELGTKAYLLYDLNTGTVHISKDVVFEETKSWQWNVQEMADTDALSSFTVVGVPFEVESNVENDENTESTSHTPRTSVSSAQTSASSTSTGGEQSSGYSSDSSEPPQHFRLISDIYDDTKEMKLVDELFFLGII